MATTTEVMSSANELLGQHSVLLARVRAKQIQHREQLQTLISPPEELTKLPLIPEHRTPSPTPESSETPPPEPPAWQQEEPAATRKDLPPAKRARMKRYRNYVPEEETIRNDYSQRYVDGGEWPQNWVQGADPDRRHDEYPKQHRLLVLKKESVATHALPPFYLSYSDLSQLQQTKFDSILVDPPFTSNFTWDDLQELPIPSLAADPSFVFLWVGSGAGGDLERGREVLAKWGYRRCEDVVWVQTNKMSNKGPGTDRPTSSLLTRTKQHCLIGIRGTVRRSTDHWFVHCNNDTDVIIWEGDPTDPFRKPPEMYTLIEHFCLGLRRLEIFGRAPSSLRRGWVTVLAPGQEKHIPPGLALHVPGETGGEATRWQGREAWTAAIRALAEGPRAVIPSTTEIEALRPKSPVRNQPGGGSQGGGSQGGGRGPGGGGMMNIAPRFSNGGGGQKGGQGGGGMANNPMIGGSMGMGMDPSMLWGGMMGGGMGMGGMGMPGMMQNAGMGQGMQGGMGMQGVGGMGMQGGMPGMQGGGGPMDMQGGFQGFQGPQQGFRGAQQGFQGQPGWGMEANWDGSDEMMMGGGGSQIGATGGMGGGGMGGGAGMGMNPGGMGQGMMPPNAMGGGMPGNMHGGGMPHNVGGGMPHNMGAGMPNMPGMGGGMSNQLGLNMPGGMGGNNMGGMPGMNMGMRGGMGMGQNMGQWGGGGGNF
ncbi:MT-A70-domain-containing protein [Schizophyllum commune]